MKYNKKKVKILLNNQRKFIKNYNRNRTEISRIYNN